MEEFEDSEFVASEHDTLVSAVSKLDKTQHITEPTRSEPTNSNSEFNLIKRSSKLNLDKVAKVLGDTAKHVKISKRLKKTQDSSTVLPKPLEKPQAERIKRATGYEVTKKKMGRWDPVVAQSRTAEFTVFPIKPVETKMQPTNEFLKRFELKSQLEKELEEVDPPAFVEEEVEEEKIYPMSYEEMVEHRQQAAKLRAQQSYKEAKAKRQSKIKSKKFHRVLKKERLKLQLKEFEELQKTDPEEALKKLESIEKSRALERHTLRHKNTGKWAKNLMIRAKYDKDVRQQLAEQLAVSRGLTQKTQDVESSDNEGDDDDDDENIPDMTLAQDPMNPWMMKQSNKSNINAEFDFGYKKYVQNKMVKQNSGGKSDTDSDDDDDEKSDKISSELTILRHSINKMTQNVSDITDEINILEEKSTSKSSETSENVNKDKDRQQSDHEVQKTKSPKSNKQKKLSIQNKMNTLVKSKLLATSNWVVEPIQNPNVQDKAQPADISTAFDSLENTVARNVEKKLKTLRERIEKMEKHTKNKKTLEKNSPEPDNLEYLKFKSNKKRAIIDEELIESGSKDDALNDIQSPAKILNTASTIQESGDLNIDPDRFIAVKPKFLNTALPGGDNGLDMLDDDEQVVPRVNIEEVFEEDDVVASFRQEKEDEANKDKPLNIDLSLPGWGSWGGKGVKPQKRKRNRFILKAPPKMPRRDENKGSIIIKEYKDPKLSSHKVKDIPFPFESVKDYEASIRAPLGNTFIPEKAHRSMIKPSVITKAGAVIQPMDEDELLLKKNKRFVNEKVLKILGQK